jgi:hypothetical protein
MFYVSQILADGNKMLRNLFRTRAALPQSASLPEEAYKRNAELERSTVVGRRLSIRLWPRPTSQIKKKVVEVYKIPYADLVPQRAHGQKVGSEEVRELCELIRKRYALDVDIWSLRDARSRDRDAVWVLIRRADAALAKIQRTLDSWDREDLFDSHQDWIKLQDIKKRMDAVGKRDWMNNPPWKDLDEE